MFEQSFVDGSRTKTKYSLAASLLMQSVMIGVAVLIPLIYTNPLPARQVMSYLLAPSPPAAAPARPAVVRMRPAALPKFDEGKLVSPTVVPERLPSSTIAARYHHRRSLRQLSEFTAVCPTAVTAP